MPIFQKTFLIIFFPQSMIQSKIIYCIYISRSLVSFNLEKYLSLSLSFTTLTVLKVMY